MRVQIFLEAGIPPARVAELGALAEQAGIQTLWASSFPGKREPLLCLSALAANRPAIRIGAVPLSPYETHPLKMAEGLLTLNEMSGGRMAATIGGMGHSVMRVTGLTPDRRVSAVRDCVQIIRAAASGDMQDYHGKVYTLQNYQADWLTAPPPLLYVGANGPQMLRMAGNVADGVMLSDVPLELMGEVHGHMRRGRDDGELHGKPLRVANFFAWHIKEDKAAAVAEARMEMIWRGLLQPWHTIPFLGEDDAAFIDSKRDAFLQAFLQRTPDIDDVPEHLIEKLVDHLTFTGGPDDIDAVAEKLNEFAGAGLDEVTLKIHGDAEEAIRLIGERLIPAL
ncbi:MAG: LLM class flavin-dependent oxidoreductase [Gammaproteobacteria bacterium]|nr:LLM class flavin-dependent oxidoreductase [Gammaproteobacteria bacterium]NND54805.1 LLM class flavin-dependent oxidoreductase [Gammaproteobacteria bacterium]